MIQIDVHINKWSMAKTIKLVKWRGVDSSLCLVQKSISVQEAASKFSLIPSFTHFTLARSNNFYPNLLPWQIYAPQPHHPPKIVFLSLFFSLFCGERVYFQTNNFPRTRTATAAKMQVLILWSDVST